MKPRELVFASCTPGLEEVLAAEAQALGEVRRVAGGVEIEGSPGLHRRANLWLRTASRVLLRLHEGPIKGIEDLEQGLRRIPLRTFLGKARPQMEIVVHRSKLRPRWIEEVARRLWGPGPSKGTEAGAPSVRIRIDGERCMVSLDSTGELLHRRGYRQEISRGPLRETLAAGMLALAGYRGDQPLWDPMCGSGTLPIEASLIALRRAPGRDRHFAFENWLNHDGAVWQEELASARAGERSTIPAPIIASDLHSGALRKAERNARRAAVLDEIRFSRHDATKPRADLPTNGLLVANLPYGIRSGARDELAALYRAFGIAMRALEGWRAALLVTDRNAEAQLAWNPDRVHDLDNGGLRCRLLSGNC
jgi:putative N6-adenine-specific DNA methylase